MVTPAVHPTALGAVVEVHVLDRPALDDPTVTVVVAELVAAPPPRRRVLARIEFLDGVTDPVAAAVLARLF